MGAKGRKVFTTQRQNLLLSYIDYLEQEGPKTRYDARGRYIFYVKHFLQQADNLNYAGYLSYYKSNLPYFADNPGAKDAIHNFLSFRGEYRRAPKKEATESIVEPLQELTVQQKEILAGFLLFLQNERDYSDNTISSYATSVKQFFKYCGEFSQDNARRFIATLECQRKAPQTIRLRITAMEKLGEYLNRPVKLKRPKMNRTLHTDNIPTEAEYERLCDYLKEHDEAMYIAVRIFGTTGCRWSEFSQLTYEMVSTGDITLKGKGNKYRQFFFVKELQQMAKDKTGPIVLNRYGTAISPEGFRGNLRIYFKKCKIDLSKAHPHAFRHFFAKMYLRKTKDVVQLADFLGHGSVDTTRIYLRKSHDEQKREINRVVTW